MFKFLKEKLNTWIKKSKEPELSPEPEKPKKEKKQSQIKADITKNQVGVLDKEIQEITKSSLKPEEKAKSRLDWFKKKITAKNLLAEFKTLEKIFSAPEDQLRKTIPENKLKIFKNLLQG